MQKKIAFFSYRNNRLTEKEKKLCKNSEKVPCNIVSRVYENCTVNNCSFKQCLHLVDFLKSIGKIDNAIVFPPVSLLPAGTMLSPYEFLLITTDLDNALKSANIFFTFNIEQPGNSLWTYLEREMWQRHCDNPAIYNIKINKQHEVEIDGPLELEPFSQKRKEMWASIKADVLPEPMVAGGYLGRYSRSTCLVQCSSCNNHFLISRNAAKYFINNNYSLLCPYCGEGRMYFSSEPIEDNLISFSKRWSLFYKCVTEKPNKISKPIDVERLLSIVYDETKNAPKGFPLICLRQEKFQKNLPGLAIPQIMGNIIKRGVDLLMSAKPDEIALRYWGVDGNYYEV